MYGNEKKSSLVGSGVDDRSVRERGSWACSGRLVDDCFWELMKVFLGTGNWKRNQSTREQGIRGGGGVIK